MLASISLLVLLQPPIENAAILAQVQNAESSWRIGTPMPSPRTEVTSVDLNDGIYVIGSLPQMIRTLISLKCIT